MKLLVVGDVHGCLNTFEHLLKNHWDPESEILVQLGDLIDRGNFSPQTLLFAFELKKKFMNNTYFLKGNHEYELLKHMKEGPNLNWLRQCGEVTLRQFEIKGINTSSFLSWIEEMPLFWGNDHLLITHAGIASETDDPFNESNPNGVLWNRTPVKNISRLQIIGHTPCRSHKPEYDEQSDKWNIDSGVYMNYGLSAIKVTEIGEVLEVIQVPTLMDDVRPENIT